MNNKFLTTEQDNQLKVKNWITKPEGKYITLYKDDFIYSAWEEVCQQLDIDTNTEQVDILYFGTQTN